MSSRKKRKKKLKKLAKKLDVKGSLATFICVGKKCCPREVSRELARDMRDYAHAKRPEVRVIKVGCLHICKKGPIVATYPDIEFHKRVDADEGHELIDNVAHDE